MFVWVCVGSVDVGRVCLCVCRGKKLKAGIGTCTCVRACVHVCGVRVCRGKKNHSGYMKMLVWVDVCLH
jgi:hypothetical protein